MMGKGGAHNIACAGRWVYSARRDKGGSPYPFHDLDERPLTGVLGNFTSGAWI